MIIAISRRENMQLTQPEIIQILRKRAGFSQAELGSRAFETTPNSGRTKIKNIELGRQLATDHDLRLIAKCLDVPAETLQPKTENNATQPGKSEGGVLVSQKIVDMFPNLEKYLEMLDKAEEIKDIELFGYLAKKIAEIFQIGPDTDSSPLNQMTSID
jgi:transcriptional regulator with XRE-family HTH domain